MGWESDVRFSNSRFRSFCLTNPTRLVAQVLGPSESDGLQHSRQYASFDWSDLWTIAPWLEEIITTRIDGPGLGH